jgi:hypothetical protein
MPSQRVNRLDPVAFHSPDFDFRSFRRADCSRNDEIVVVLRCFWFFVGDVIFWKFFLGFFSSVLAPSASPDGEKEKKKGKNVRRGLGSEVIRGCEHRHINAPSKTPTNLHENLCPNFLFTIPWQSWNCVSITYQIEFWCANSSLCRTENCKLNQKQIRVKASVVSPQQLKILCRKITYHLENASK